MDGFVAWWAANVALPKEISVFIVSMIPLIEERGGLILARMLNMSLGSAVFWCVIGNILPIPFILFGIKKLLHWLSSHHMSKLAEMIEHKAEKNRPKIDRYGFFGLMPPFCRILNHKTGTYEQRIYPISDPSSP